MNNPNPFIPQGSVLEQNKRRSRMKFAVGCVVIAGTAGLTAILINGCTREKAPEVQPPAPFVDTNPPPVLDTNPPPMMPTNPVALPPIAPPPVAPVVPEATGTEYKVVKGDTLAKIAKAHGVTLKALEDANKGVEPAKLKINQKLTIPAGGTTAPATIGTAGSPNAASGGGEVYVVKSGDTLTKIAKAHSTTVKVLQAENNLATTQIKVGQKLKLPAKAEVAAPVTAPPAAPVAPEPMTPPVSSPPPVGAPTGR